MMKEILRGKRRNKLKMSPQLQADILECMVICYWAGGCLNLEKPFLSKFLIVLFKR